MLTMTLCAALSAIGLAVALLLAWRRRLPAAARTGAVALLPAGLAMTGLLRLAGDFVRDVGSWASGLVLSPLVWAGFALLVCSVALWCAARAAGRRSRRTRAGAPAADTPQKPGGDSLRASSQSTSRGKGSGGGEDYSEIEEILKKHGI